jgi:hypothetical protein
MKKNISKLLLLLFLTQISASFLYFDCSMTCCQKEIVSCCLSDTIQKDCPTLGGVCETVVFLPIVSFYPEKIDHKIKLSLNDFFKINTLIDIVFSRISDAVNYQLFSKPPPAFNSPLLI